MKKNKEDFLEDTFITCECGYNNFKNSAELYGQCKRCNKIINDKAYFKYKLYKATHAWKGKRW